MPAQVALEAEIVDAEGARGQAFVSHVHKVRAFINKHGRNPRSRARGDLISAEELSEGNWVRDMRKRRDRQSKARLSLVDLVLPGLMEPEREYLDWEVRLRQVAEFQKKHGHLPRLNNADPLPGETILANWRNEVKRKRTLLTAEKLELIDSVCPGLLDSNTWQPWDESLDEYLAHVNVHGKDPRQDVAEERKLGLWVTKMRSYPEKITSSQRTILEERAPSLLAPSRYNEKHLAKRILEIQAFREHSGRWPRCRVKGSSDEEALLGRWCYIQRRRATAMSPERLQTIQAGLPGMLEEAPLLVS